MSPRSLLFLAALLPASAAPAARTTLEDDLLRQINFARAHPGIIADRLVTYRGYFDGLEVHFPGNPVTLISREGVAPVDEAIAELRAQAPLPPLTASDLLSLAAGDHAAEQGLRGVIGHDSADGSSPGQRVKRRGGDIYVAETISYGSDTASDVIRQLIVDDGVKSRGHRRILFSIEYHYAGAGCGPHTRYGTMCVVDFSRKPDGRP